MNLLDAIEFHPSSQMLELQAEQFELIRQIYQLMYECEKNPLDSFVRHDLDKARADYEQTVADLQLLHILGADCPAHYCDSDLYSLYSDMHKEAYGFRYRGDMSVAGIVASMPLLQASITADESYYAEMDAMRTEADEQEQREFEEGRALVQSYRTDFDHFDPRLAKRVPTNQVPLILALRA